MQFYLATSSGTSKTDIWGCQIPNWCW